LYTHHEDAGLSLRWDVSRRAAGPPCVWREHLWHTTHIINVGKKTNSNSYLKQTENMSVQDAPIGGSMKTEYASNGRSKCQLCRMKLAKESWRIQIAVTDPYHNHRTSWESSHASCYFENVTSPVDLRDSNQSMPYFGHSTATVWSKFPGLTFPASEEGDMIRAAIAALDSSDTLEQVLPTEALRACFGSAVVTAFPGAEDLSSSDRAILELFCLHKGLNGTSKNLLRASLKAEVAIQPDLSGDPLKGKFTQYSPNS
jgi:hypothetical protein